MDHLETRNRMSGISGISVVGRLLICCGLLGTASVMTACGESGSCGEEGSLTGRYVSSAAGMTLQFEECDGEVSGRVHYQGTDYPLDGTVESDVVQWRTEPVAFCDDFGIERDISSSEVAGPFTISEDRESVRGRVLIFEVDCVTREQSGSDLRGPYTFNRL